MLSQASNLTTVLLSSNLFSCNAPAIDSAKHLGEGLFELPADVALKLCGAFVQSQTRMNWQTMSAMTSERLQHSDFAGVGHALSAGLVSSNSC